MSFLLLNKATAIKASPAVRLRGKGVVDHTVEVILASRAAAKISAATVILQGSMTGEDKDTGIVVTPALAIDSTAERFANGAFYYLINGTTYYKAADSAGNQFTAAHAVTAEKYGAINVFIDTAGTWITRAPSALQAYNTAEEAHDAADLIMTPMAAECYCGRILINAKAGVQWDANTDDMTDGSDLTTATFLSAGSSFYDLSTHALSAAEITAQRAMFHVGSTHVDFARVFLSALTGTGEITVRYTPVEVMK